MTEQEICAHCKQPKPIVLILRLPEGEDCLLCQICANRWLLSDEEWPPTTAKFQGKTSTQNNP